MGTLLSQNPEKSIGNKPVNGLPNILGTERTIANQPYSTTEKSLLTQAGILYINQMPRSESLLGFTHGQSGGSLGVPGIPSARTGLNWADMTNYLVKGLYSTLGKFVDELQGQSATDDTRSNITAQLNAWLQILKKANRIGNFQVINDLSVNLPTTIAEGYVLPYILVQYLATARFIVPTLNAGADVQIVTGPAVNFS
jgi:phage tail sheath protein FI